ncbi:zinc carboxypeptidase [Hyalella azteca]|uniref:Zinc carboxypeptidase n=1 Tax=Hyalella azteca TaxID=294128 RepID=A0A8B7P7M0_HYAAZ|nr:zinc carboxypeptidase [Hyalella azteca]
MVIIRPSASATATTNETGGPAVIILDSATHAREWLTVSTTLYVIQQLLDQPSSPARGVEWRIIPVVNPDGYVYSWEKDRLWRKNRRSLPGHCQGVDLNRNFDVNFGGSSFTAACTTFAACRASFELL